MCKQMKTKTKKQKPKTKNQKPKTKNQKPNPKPQTANPKPQTPNRKPRAHCAEERHEDPLHRAAGVQEPANILQRGLRFEKENNKGFGVWGVWGFEYSSMSHWGGAEVTRNRELGMMPLCEHVARHTSHVTRHTSHVTHPTCNPCIILAGLPPPPPLPNVNNRTADGQVRNKL